MGLSETGGTITLKALRGGHVLCIAASLGLFVALYIFYMHVHPVIPWTGDDWMTYCDWGSSYIFFDLPKETLQNYNIILNMLGSLFGFLGAFVIYPLCGDYIMALTSANAIAQALFICVAINSIFHFIYKLTSNRHIAWSGTAMFLLFAFGLMKTNYQANYLFDVQASMTLYCYNIPSYCAVSFSLFLIIDHLEGREYHLDIRSALMIACLYLIMFSFFPAAVFIATVSGAILLCGMITYRSIWKTLKGNWFHVITLLLFPIKAYLEIKRTFGTGYMSSPTDFSVAFKTALLTILTSFTKMHVIFIAVSVVGIGGVLVHLVLQRFCRKNTDNKGNWNTLFFVLVIVLVIDAIFYILFGAVSFGHIAINTEWVRLDTMYCMYALLVLAVVLCWVYLMQHCAVSIILIPVLLIMMLGVVTCTPYQYNESYYSDTTAEQKYEIMNAVFKEACARDERGEKQMIVHMPLCAHWECSVMPCTLNYHNITYAAPYITYVYDLEPGGDIWFE